ncbi:hypothetical protein HQ560_08740 [bacterium]|nr:hypothetical protein [bacterium]
MYRYRLTVYYDDKVTDMEVAQKVVVLGEDDQAALAAARDVVAHDAAGGRVRGMRVIEKERVTPGVKFRGDPYIPFAHLTASAEKRLRAARTRTIAP